MVKKWLIVLLGLFLIYDTIRSFNQHLHMPLDGDMALIVVPGDVFKHAMQKPFAVDAVFYGKTYHAPNRAFAHWTMSLYFKTVPFVFQLFSSPLDSIYLSAALAKIIFQLLICFMLARYVNPTSLRLSDVVISMAILTPLFQTGGFNRTMGIIDQSITYSFFYALPVGLLLIFFFPFYRYFLFGGTFNFGIIKHVVWFFLMVFLAFNGPLTPAIAGVTIASIFCVRFLYHLSGLKIIKMNSTVRNYLLFFGLLALYSLYAGTFNSENFSTPQPIYERYKNLVMGLTDFFVGNMALPLLLFMIVLNAVVLRKLQSKVELFKITIPIAVFCLIFILFLPLGGYRHYRPNILRYDTAIPILMAIFFLVVFSSKSLIERSFKYKTVYSLFLTGILLFFHFSDGHVSNQNQSEKRAILKIAESDKKCVFIQDNCTIMSYKLINDSLESSLNSQLLQYWGVFNKPKMYYQ